MEALVLENLSSEELAEAADENLITHVGWVQQRLPGMRVEEEHGLTLVDSGLPCDTFNQVCRTRLEQHDASHRIHATVDYFRQAERPFAWWVGPGFHPADLGERLNAAGLEQVETEQAMAADLSALSAEAALPPGLRVVRVSAEAELCDFARLLALDGLQLDPHVLRFYELAAPLLLAADCPLRLYVGYQDDVPVATGELTLGGGVAGLYNITTSPDYRRRGIGSRLVWTLLQDAAAQGYRTAILQATVEGESLYKRMGFHIFGTITEYKPPMTDRREV